MAESHAAVARLPEPETLTLGDLPDILWRGTKDFLRDPFFGLA